MSRQAPPTDKIDLLDHGFVRLIDHMGDDLSVVRAARVSYDAAWRAGLDEKSDARLINYLWKNRHTTPFEAVVFTFEVKAPIFVFRQWHRHRTWSFNELSARYRELPEEFYVPEPGKIGRQSAGNKQKRVIDDDPNVAWGEAISNDIAESCRMSFVQYRTLLNRGVPRELARVVLPLGTYSHMFATIDLRNLLAFFTLRSDEHAQDEIIVYSDAMIELVREYVPVSLQAWVDNSK
jgi:thymidylate synthase (FAD)